MEIRDPLSLDIYIFRLPIKSRGFIRRHEPAHEEKNKKGGLPITEHQFYEAFERLFGPYDESDKTVHSKYKNTVDFINNVLNDT